MSLHVYDIAARRENDSRPAIIINSNACKSEAVDVGNHTDDGISRTQGNTGKLDSIYFYGRKTKLTITCAEKQSQ